MPQTDLAQLAAARAGDETAIAALIAKLMPAIRIGAASAVCPGLEFEDAVQEGIIGLFRAVSAWQPGRNASFTTYACVCIQNAQFSAQRAASRKKHAPLNSSVPLTDEASVPGPDEQLIRSEEVQAVMTRMCTRLSPRERSVLNLYLDGSGCTEIAAALGIAPKAAENALGRARRKLKGS